MANISKGISAVHYTEEMQSYLFPVVTYQESLEAIRLLEKFQHPRVGKVCLIHRTGASAQRWCLDSGPLSSHGSGSSCSCILFQGEGKTCQWSLPPSFLADLLPSSHQLAQVSAGCQQESWEGGTHPLPIFPVGIIRIPGHSTAYIPSICNRLRTPPTYDSWKRNINAHRAVLCTY